MRKFRTRAIVGFALSLAGVGLALGSAANAQVGGAYTDPSYYVRSSLEREHLVLSHTDAVRKGSTVAQRSYAYESAPQAGIAGWSAKFVFPGSSNASIRSQSGN